MACRDINSRHRARARVPCTPQLHPWFYILVPGRASTDYWPLVATAWTDELLDMAAFVAPPSFTGPHKALNARPRLPNPPLFAQCHRHIIAVFPSWRADNTVAPYQPHSVPVPSRRSPRRPSDFHASRVATPSILSSLLSSCVSVL